MKTLTFLTEGVFGNCSGHLDFDCNDIIKIFLKSTFPNYQELISMLDLSEEIVYLDIEYIGGATYNLSIEYDENSSERLIQAFHHHLLSAINIASHFTQGIAEYSNSDFTFQMWLSCNKELQMKVYDVY